MTNIMTWGQVSQMLDRRTWQEIEWNIRIDFAATYLKYADMAGLERQFAVNWIGQEDLGAWAAEHINNLLAMCNLMTTTVSIGHDAIGRAKASLEALAENRERLGLLEVVL